MSSDPNGNDKSPQSPTPSHIKTGHKRQISNDPNFSTKLNFFREMNKINSNPPSYIPEKGKRTYNNNTLSKSLTPPRTKPTQNSNFLTPRDIPKTQSFHSTSVHNDFPIKRSSEITFRKNSDFSESQDSDTDSSVDVYSNNNGHNESSEDIHRINKMPRVEKLLVHINESIRIFVWDYYTNRSVAMTIRRDWDMNQFLNSATVKLNSKDSYKYVYYKKNNSEIDNIDDIQNNDELVLTCEPLHPVNDKDVRRKSSKPKLHQRNRTLESPRVNRKARIRSILRYKGTAKLERAESETQLFERILEQQRKEAIERIRQRNLKQYDEVFSYVQGTRIKKKSSNFENEIVRSHSLLDIKILSTIPQEIHKPKNSNTSESLPSSESNLSGIECTDDDMDDEFENRKEYYQLNKDVTFDIEEPETKNVIDPLTISNEEVYRRMKEEEQQDLQNIEVGEDGEVKAGTFRGLVRRLVSHLQSPDYIEAFLLTYDLFLSHDALLVTLILLFRSPLSENSNLGVSLSESSESESTNSFSSPRNDIGFILQFRICNIICEWIRLRYDSLRSCKKFVELFERFTNFKGINSEKHKKLQQELKKAWNTAKKKRYELKRNLHVSKPVKPDVRYMTIENRSVLSIDPVDLAKQLTVMEQDLFGRVQLSDYHNFMVDKTKSPRVSNMIKRFNKISFWTATLILDPQYCKTSKQRGQTISHFIMVMHELRKLKNFNTMLQIFSALNMKTVSRLTKSWAYVSSKCMDILNETAKLFESNYREYRQEIELIDPPCIPIQEVILRDITFIEESKTILDNGWINFEKIYLLGRTYKTIKKFQSEQYDLKSDDQLYGWALSIDILTDEKLFTISFEIQPSEELKAKRREEKKLNRMKLSSSDRRLSKKNLKQEIQQNKSTTPNSSKSKWKIINDTKFMEKYRLPKDFKKPEVFEKFAKYSQSLLAINTLEFCEDILELWHSLDFNDESPENIKRVKSNAITIYSRYISETSDKALSLETPSIKRLKEKLVSAVNIMLPESLFEEITFQVVSQINTHFSTFKYTL